MENLSNKYNFNELEKKQPKRGKIIPFSDYTGKAFDNKPDDSFSYQGNSKSMLDFLYFLPVGVLIVCIIPILYLGIFRHKIKSRIASIVHL